MPLLAADTRTSIPLAPTRSLPYLELDLAQAVRNVRHLDALMPRTAVHYVVRANPQPDLLAALAGAGCDFVVTTPAEVRACLAAGAAPDDLVFNAPLAPRADLAAVAALGVRLFVIGSPEGVADAALAAPGSSVLCRIVPKADGRDEPGRSSRRPGCSADQAVRLLRQAAASGLDPAGVSFHVGSDQPYPRAWRSPISASARIFDALRTAGLRPWLLDLGGGFPAALTDGAPPDALYAAQIDRQLHQEFGIHRPRTLLSTGRAVVAEAGRLVGRVVSVQPGDTRRIRVDVEVSRVADADEVARHRLSTAATGPGGPAVLVGPGGTRESGTVRLPLALAVGDRVEYRSVGAYTTCHAGSDAVPLRLVGR